MLELKNTGQGLLLPRLTRTQRVAITSPVAGLLIFQADGTVGSYYYTGIFWLTAAGFPSLLTGAVSTLAGSGTAGAAYGTGAAARFSFPNGTVYVADLGNNRIRVINN